MKKIILSLAIVAIAFTVNAQDKKKDAKEFKFSVGVEAGLPLGDFKETSSIGIGGSVMGEYAAAEAVGITISAGYITFSGKKIDLGGGLGSFKFGSASIVPVLAGVKYYFSEQFYGHAQLGMSFLNAGAGSAFTYAPTVGFMASENIDISLKYQAFSKGGGTTSFLGLRIAYAF